MRRRRGASPRRRLQQGLLCLGPLLLWLLLALPLLASGASTEAADDDVGGGGGGGDGPGGGGKRPNVLGHSHRLLSGETKEAAAGMAKVAGSHEGQVRDRGRRMGLDFFERVLHTPAGDEFAGEDALFHDALDFQWRLLAASPAKPAPFLVCGPYRQGKKKTNVLSPTRLSRLLLACYAVLIIISLCLALSILPGRPGAGDPAATGSG